ncbi:MAG: hypothetical protein JWM28_3302 [Chitinophagaceae bacterium]|nr:hypothetical protein [Chitinophagaceae bacterium]
MFSKRNSTLIVLALISVILSNCKEQINGPLPGSDAVPALVTNATVTNLHGAATIRYHVPADPGLLYVEAEWTYKGVTRNTKSSYYSDSLAITGFGDTNPCTVQIYSVGQTEKRSAPISVTVNPLSAPVQDVFKTLVVKPDFGGINVAFTNAAAGNLVISVFTKDKNGVNVVANSFYTNLLSGNFSTRGFDATPRVFGIVVKDRWNNLSDTLYTTQTPLFELQLNKALFRELTPYTGDVNSDIYSSAYPLKNVWDNNLTTIYVTKLNLGMPESFTIDLGVKATLSRMKYWQRQSTAFYYAAQCPNVFEVYGSNSPPADGSYNGWTLITICNSQKPSGLPLGITTNDDIAAAQAGEDFNFPISNQGYRYLRFKVTSTYGNSTSINFAELTLWGAY